MTPDQLQALKRLAEEAKSVPAKGLKFSARARTAIPDLIAEVERLQGLIGDLVAPQHLMGCLFAADPRMPCQCGSNERWHKFREAERVGKEMTAALSKPDDGAKP